MDFTTIILVIFAIIGAYLIFTNQVEGRAKIILLVALFIIFIVIFTNLPMFKSYNEFLSSPVSAMEASTIAGTAYKANSTSYSVSTWIYIQDWNINYGTPKNIMNRNHNPSLQLDEFENNLIIKFQTINTSSVTTPVNNIIKIPNISIQKWVNITCCFGDKTVDTYINGKLVDTFVTPNVQNISPLATTTLPFSVGNGFSGSISNTRYYNIFLSPQEAWDIYRGGFSNNMFGNFLNQFNASITFHHNEDKHEFYLM